MSLANSFNVWFDLVDCVYFDVIFIKDHVVFIEHTSTKLVIVDPMTKAPLIKYYWDQVDGMGLANPFNILVYFF
jgi:hypothetical protein